MRSALVPSHLRFGLCACFHPVFFFRLFGFLLTVQPYIYVFGACLCSLSFLGFFLVVCTFSFFSPRLLLSSVFFASPTTIPCTT
ncbi:uncharacterized protein EI90DRAFT_3041062 [Cantharellus anzutake]|uniref:uncharacterized protein n=1 Tax=Cantharellus anzutake TaxID=1750568 RepID=UPI00190594C4|nr:uncharacterized protein EI90DRAFT_3041062 [Cantharellus anzutake]KAF8337929.1 hypothetical protein EI90DRAFT_3041062 [Cantharellus anzutake]